MTTFEQSDNLESLQTELADEIALSDKCQKDAMAYSWNYAVTGIFHELRIKRLERMIKAEKKQLKQATKAEKKQLAPEAAGIETKLDAILAAVTPRSGSYEFEEGEDGC